MRSGPEKVRRVSVTELVEPNAGCRLDATNQAAQLNHEAPAIGSPSSRGRTKVSPDCLTPRATIALPVRALPPRDFPLPQVHNITHVKESLRGVSEELTKRKGPATEGPKSDIWSEGVLA